MLPDLSAANDLNKIIRAEYENPFYTRVWRSMPYASGRQQIYLLHTTTKWATCRAPRQQHRRGAVAHLQVAVLDFTHVAFRDQIEPIESRNDIRRVASIFDGPMTSPNIIGIESLCPSI